MGLESDRKLAADEAAGFFLFAQLRNWVRPADISTWFKHNTEFLELDCDPEELLQSGEGDEPALKGLLIRFHGPWSPESRVPDSAALALVALIARDWREKRIVTYEACRRISEVKYSCSPKMSDRLSDIFWISNGLDLGGDEIIDVERSMDRALEEFLVDFSEFDDLIPLL